jgi:acyl-CoA thioesterase
VSTGSIDILGNRWRRMAPGRLEGSLSEDWYQGRTIFGGLVAAVLARAAEDAVGDPVRQPRSLTVQFSAPVSHGEASAVAEVVRAGKYVSQIRGAVEQGGKPVALMLATFGAARAAPITWPRPGDGSRVADDAMPQVPPPNELASFEGGASAPRFTRHFDLRFAIGSPPFRGAPRPEVGGWCRLRSAAPTDLVTICALLDVWPPPALSMLTAPTPGATMDLTYHLLAPLPLAPASSEPTTESARHEGWFLFRYRAPTIGDGYSEQFGEMWASDGRLVGRVRQMAAVF